MHHAHTVHTQYIRNFVRIGEHRRRAMGDNRARKFSGRQHTAFDVHMRIAKTRDDVTPRDIRNFCIGANAMAGVWANIGKTSVFDRDLSVIQHLPGVNTDDATTSQNKVSGRPSSGDCDKIGGNILQCGERFRFHVQS